MQFSVATVLQGSGAGVPQRGPGSGGPHYRKKVNGLINFRTELLHKGARIVYIARQLHSIGYYH